MLIVTVEKVAIKGTNLNCHSKLQIYSQASLLQLAGLEEFCKTREFGFTKKQIPQKLRNFFSAGELLLLFTARKSLRRKKAIFVPVYIIRYL